jgi:signal transduction histidine kinase
VSCLSICPFRDPSSEYVLFRSFLDGRREKAVTVAVKEDGSVVPEESGPGWPAYMGWNRAPLILCMRGGAVLLPMELREHPYCSLVWEICGNQGPCEEYYRQLAWEAEEGGRRRATTCHAGLHNCMVPILRRGDLDGLLVFGQARLCGEGHERHERESTSARAEFAALHSLSPEQGRALEEAFEGMAPVSESDIESMMDLSGRIAHFISIAFDRYLEDLVGEKKELERNMESLVHDVVIRLQGVVARCDNLHRRLDTTAGASKSATQEEIWSIMMDLSSMGTVARNWPSYLGDYDFRPVEIGAVLQRVLDKYDGEAKRKDVVLELDLEPLEESGVILEVSERHFVVCVENLVQNGVKYSFKGTSGRPRYVRITGMRAGDQRYMFVFENFGIGILADELEKVFDRGYQGRLREGEDRPGAGLGLYYARRVVRKHRGRIWAVSKDMKSGYLTLIKLVLPVRQTKLPAGR